MILDDDIRALITQTEALSADLHQLALSLRATSIYQTVRFWASLVAIMAVNLGTVFIIGGQTRITASAYFLIAYVGHVWWGVLFCSCGAFTLWCACRWHSMLRWALLLEALPYVGLSASFAIAAWKYPDANLTAAPVYIWLAIAHILLSDFARHEF